MALKKPLTIQFPNGPILIDSLQWPIVAKGARSACDNQYEFQAFRRWKASITVRQHTDGRAIVYGHYEFSTQYPMEEDCDLRDGVHCSAGADIPLVIRQVAQALETDAAASEQEHGDIIAKAMRDCLANMPPKMID